MIGNVASKFQLNTMIQTKDINFFMNLVDFFAFSWWIYNFDHAHFFENFFEIIENSGIYPISKLSLCDRVDAN